MTHTRETAGAWVQEYLTTKGGSAPGAKVNAAAMADGYAPSTLRAGRLTAAAPWIAVTRDPTDTRRTVWSLTDTQPAPHRSTPLPGGLGTTHHRAYRELMALVDAHPVPCRTDRHRHAWTSPDTEDQEYAATRCTACPIRRACRQYATRWTETGGVWGGRQEPAEKNPNPQRKDNQQ